MINKLFRLLFPAQPALEIAKKYHIPSKISLKFESKNGWIVATSDDLPGFITEARNHGELLEMVNDGILTYFDVPRRDADIIFKQMSIGGFGTVSLNDRSAIV